MNSACSLPNVKPRISPAKQRVVRSALAAAMLIVFCVPVSAEEPLVDSVVSVGYTVRNMDTVVNFFEKVLTFKKVEDTEVVGEDFEALYGVFGARIRVVKLTLGDEAVTLKQFIAPTGRSIPEDSRSHDGWFQHVAIVVSDMEQAYKRLREHTVTHASTGPQTLPDWNPNAGGIKAFYFKDPEGHVMELLEFPEGKGEKRWQSKERLFLGIDHTAIVVDDTEKSLTFYRDLLGMKVAGASENFGPEQERLNNVFGARLRITALRAAKGPGIELLEYLAPSTGRPFPPTTESNDLWHWHTQLGTGDLERVTESTKAKHVEWVSPGAVDIKDDDLGFDEAIMVSGPYGHQMLISEPTQ